MVSLASEFPNDNPALHRGVIWVCPEPTGGPRADRPSVANAAAEPTEPEAVECDAPALGVEPASLPTASSEEPIEVAPPKHDSLAPPEDDQIDESAGPIVVEELEPVEASLEGALCDDLRVEPFEADVPVAGTVDEAEAEHRGAPTPAHSEVVLVGARVVPEDDGAPAVTDVAPVFEEIVTSEVPRETTSLPPVPDDPFTVLVCTLADVAIGAGSPHVASLLPGLLFDGRVPESIDAATALALRTAGLWDGSEVAPAFVAVTAAWRAVLRGTSNDFDACGATMLDEWAAALLAGLLEAPAKAPMLRHELRSRGVAAFGLAA